jgi:hypothetical protein
MKPDWNSPDCPSWANYLAQYASGAWYWFEAEPELGNAGWWINSGRCCPVCRGDWRDSLEERPVCKEVEE